MACGILLVTHPGIGSSILAVAVALLRQLPLKTEAFEVPFDAEFQVLLPQASAALRRVDSGDGVLVLTDLYGASPSNLAGALAKLGTPVR
ncbi:MAG: PTS fructose IIA subunit family protein, partial [Pseudoxanthomonas sp.]